MTRISRSGKHAKGQSLVELALFAPILLLIVLVTLDLGRVYLGWVSLNNIARIGAAYAATHPSAWQGTGNATYQANYRQLMGNDGSGIDCTLPSPLPDPSFPDPAPNTYIVGSHVTVNLNCNFRLLTPLLSDLIGDGAGNVPVGATTTFVIRASWTGTQPIGGGNPTPTPSPTPTPTPSPTATPAPTFGSGGGSPTPSPTAAPPTVTFYGTPNGLDSYGGGSDPTDPNYNQIVGVPNLYVTFFNTTSGSLGTCLWNFGDGTTSTSCNNQVNHTYPNYPTRGTYDVSLSVDGGSLTRSGYVLVGCKVPSFSGVRMSNASSLWTDTMSSSGGGFAAANISFLPGSGDYKINTQTLAGGLVNPPGGCSGATITVGP